MRSRFGIITPEHYFILAAAIVVLSGCGDDRKDSGGNGNVAGTVFSETHTGLASAELVVMERQTNLKYEAVSGADGSYTFSLPAGTYDLGVHGEGYVTFFTGPITVASAATIAKDISLTPAAGIPVSRLFGKVTTADGAPAASWKAKCSSDVDARPASVIAEATVNDDGTFAVDLGSSDSPDFKQEYLLDLDFQRPDGLLEEFVDLHKRGGPLQVELMVGGGVKNKYRHTQGPSDDGLEKIGQSVLQSEAIAQSRFALQTPFALQSWSLAKDYCLMTYNCAGRAEVGAAATAFSGSFPRFASNPSAGNIPDASTLISAISTGKNGSWWYTYKLSVWIVQMLESVKFVDETGDSYSLSEPSGQSSYHISYNSKKPTIVSATIVSDKPDTLTLPCYSY